MSKITFTVHLPFLSRVEVGDRIVTVGDLRYNPPREVIAALGPIDPGSPVIGVECAPRTGETTRFVLYPALVRGLRIVVERDFDPNDEPEGEPGPLKERCDECGTEEGEACPPWCTDAPYGEGAPS